MKSSGALYQYEFRKPSEGEEGFKVESDMAGTAIGGVDMLLSEIVSSKGHINEIDHGGKKIIFSHGKHTACILIASSQSEEFRYRLDVFHLSFEKQYKDALNNWGGDLSPFKKADDLVVSHFLK